MNTLEECEEILRQAAEHQANHFRIDFKMIMMSAPYRCTSVSHKFTGRTLRHTIDLPCLVCTGGKYYKKSESHSFNECDCCGQMMPEVIEDLTYKNVWPKA
jgi:hypothetical protein